MAEGMLSELWKERVVVLVMKKRLGEVVAQYRGVTLMPTLYKVYATALAERLKEELTGKALILVPHDQTGFTKVMGTINICMF